MIGLDTNLLVRYVTQDDAVQLPLVTRLFESLSAEEPGFISLVALIEMVWVLRSFYDASRNQIERVVEMLLRARGVIVEQRALVWMALHAYSRGNADFGDYLIECSGREAGCEHTFTFDRDAVNTAGMKLLR